MKNFILFVAAIAITCTVTAKEVMVKENRKLPAFTQIAVSGSIDVIVTDKVSEVVVETTTKQQSSVEAVVNSGTLSLRTTKRCQDDVNVYVPLKAYSKVTASGASDIKLPANFKCNDITINLSGSSDLKGGMVAKSVTIKASGSSDIELKGRAESCTADISGSSDLDLEEFAVNSMSVSASGASDIELNVSKSLKISSSGASSIKYRGNCTVEQKVSGAGKVVKMN